MVEWYRREPSCRNRLKKEAAMLVGAFELQEPVPELRQPHLISMLKPWIDVGSVGTLSLNFLEEHFGAVELGQIQRPGRFYDFTRYRPTVVWKESHREFILPNTVLRVAQRDSGPDLVFLHALEPHAMGEEFVESIVGIIETLGIQRYCSVGSMYAPVPHTRPLIASGNSNEPAVQAELEALGIRGGRYQGPTSVVSMVSQEAQKRDLGALSIIMQLPSYSQLGDDYMGQYTLLRILDRSYDFSLDLDRIRRRGERLYARLDEAARSHAQMEEMIRQLENAYDSERTASPQEGEGPALSTEIQEFLQGLERSDGNPS